MQLPLLNRERESERLRRLVGSPESAFGCVYGRRRTGKSRLIREVLPKTAAVYFVCDEREPTLQREALAAEMSRLVPGMDEVDYPQWASLFERWWREAPPGTVLVLDEFPYMARGSPEVPSILQRLVDQRRFEPLHLLVCGSSQRMMQGLVLEGSAPLYGRAREIIKVGPLGASWLGEAMRLSDPVAVLQAYAVWGGMPWYWELSREYADAWQATEALVLDPMGALHNEPARLLLDDMRDTVQAASILSAVGSGCNRMWEIAGRLGKPATSLARPMGRLLDLGLVRREVPFGASERTSKQTLYHLGDAFLAFWFRFVEPNRSRLEAGLVRQVRTQVRRQFPQHLGTVWEGLVRGAFPHLGVAGEEWTPARRWWGAGTDGSRLEVDIVAESADGEALFVGEAKLRLTAKGVERARRDVERKAARLPFVDSYRRLVTGTFAAEAPEAEDVEGVVVAAPVIAACR